MSIKKYYAYVTLNMAEDFEKRLNSEKKIKLYERTNAISENGEPIYHYVIEAEEGLINSKWEL